MPRTEIEISWQQVEQDCHKLATQLKQQSFTGIIAIARGGLIPAAIVGRLLNIRRFEILSIESYTDREQHSHTIYHKPEISTGNWLIIDELSDSGATAKLVRKIYPDFPVAVMYIKTAGKDGADFYVKEFSDDVWLVYPWEKLVP